MTGLALTGVRAVTGARIVDDATVVVDGGRIDSVRAGGAAPPGAIDGRGLLVVPGLVDTHSDGLEREISPRRTVEFPIDYALGSFEGRLRAAGVTVVFHGLAYQEKPSAGRSVGQSRQLFAALDERRRGSQAPVDHCVLYRFEARDPSALDALLHDLEVTRRAGVPALVSFEDHTPGQGQYRDPAQFAAAIDPSGLPDGMTADDYVRQLIDDAGERAAVGERNLTRLAPLARSGAIRLLVHDPDGRERIELAAEAGATVAEFPVTLEAARAARELGMTIVMGAPNALRGLSHSGNTSARELVSAGLCDVLASDYMPSAMLAAAFALAGEGCCSLPAAIDLITRCPAELSGIEGRGRLEVGAQADLVLIDDSGPWPAVVGSHRAGDAAERRLLGN
jgi:alpha-D-ribose 1-methylphosphonate 5-triphosphate diphosphatase